MKFSLFLSILPLIFSYKMFDFYNLTSNPIPLYKCCNIEPKLLDTTKLAIDHINSHNIINITLKEELYSHEINDVNSICSYNDGEYDEYGFTLLTDTDEDVYINKKLLETNNTLYNVVLHELVHLMGMDHSTEPSIMSYKVSVKYPSLFGSSSIEEDRSKLWLSIDDINGLKAVKKKYDDTHDFRI